MSAGFQSGAVLYTQSFGWKPENVEVPFLADRAPTISDINYPLGKQWVFVGNSVYMLIGFTTLSGVTTATWIVLGTV